jgi:type V secretory pathway adhesin AidA
MAQKRITHMRTRTWLLVLALCLFMSTMGLVPNAQAGTQTITLIALDGSSAAGTAVVNSANGHTTLTLTVSGLTPNAVHSFWQQFDTTAPPFIVDTVLGLAVVTDDNLGTLAAVFPVGPAAADNAGFTAGTALDPNGFVTDAQGKATFTVTLNYMITKSQISPIVLAPLSQTVQVEPVTGLGECKASPGSTYQSFIDSAFARKFDTSHTNPSFQLKDGKNRAKLIRGTVANLVVVEHLDGLTHGHAPGVMTAVSGCGDHLGKLIGALAH